jgi:hypothetical protein
VYDAAVDLIASTRDGSFAPYVPAVDDDGAVAFQTTHADGRSVVIGVRDGRAREVPGSDGAESHPDLDGVGGVVF